MHTSMVGPLTNIPWFLSDTFNTESQRPFPEPGLVRFLCGSTTPTLPSSTVATNTAMEMLCCNRTPRLTSFTWACAWPPRVGPSRQSDSREACWIQQSLNIFMALDVNCHAASILSQQHRRVLRGHYSSCKNEVCRCWLPWLTIQILAVSSFISIDPSPFHLKQQKPNQNKKPNNSTSQVKSHPSLGKWDTDFICNTTKVAVASSTRTSCWERERL